MQRTSIDSPGPVTRLGSLEPGRVLHVEADAFVAALVEATLEDAGVEVDWFSTGRSALTAARAGAYDAYVLGVGLRDMSSVLLAEELARLDARVPIVFIMGSGEQLPRCLNLTVVTRPFPPHALVGAVEAALDAYREAA